MKTKLIESKIVAWAAMILIAVVVVLSVALRTPWYGLADEFFCFMGVFAHLASLYLKRMSAQASRKLDACALVCIALSLVAFLVEYIVYQVNA